ncbi:Calpain-1 catalytic subunit [Homalodisca vitripennis]|nr:Calpain-1 catalytic subunit [Homalodisca vitripennis]
MFVPAKSAAEGSKFTRESVTVVESDGSRTRSTTTTTLMFEDTTQVKKSRREPLVSSTGQRDLKRTSARPSSPYRPGSLTFSSYTPPPLINTYRVSGYKYLDSKYPTVDYKSDLNQSKVIAPVTTTKDKTTVNGRYKPIIDLDKQPRKMGLLNSKVSLGSENDELGERGSGFRKQTDIQDFYKIRDECLAEGKLWEDPEFEAVDSSIFFSRSPPRPFEWKRPMEIVDNPRLFVEGATRFDVQQGELGDCWLLAAVANLTLQPTLFHQVVPDDQSFVDKYAGIFHFRFWQYGRWVDVVVDDRLPTCYGKLVYLHSSQSNEFWSALLEKAYAKLHGSYEALKGGSTCEAMEDFTGGVSEMYDLEKPPSNLFQILLKAFERNSLMGCSIEPDPSVTEMQTAEGLVKGHAYSITRVQYVDINTPNTQGKIPLLRLRNPWGNEAEWTGAWSDKSPEWRFIPESEKQEIGLVFEEDGEFWMSYRDFTKYFMRLEICNLSPDSLTEDEVSANDKKRWEMSVFEGEWVRGVTAGGCRNYLQTFSRNPQYTITLTDVDDEDEENKCTVIVGLMQKNRRSQRRLGRDCLTIGFAVYRLEDPENLPTPLDTNFFTYNASVARSPSFINMREVSSRFTLPPGVYCIVPSTFEPNEEGEFLLRVFSEKKNNMEENDTEVGLKEMDDRDRYYHGGLRMRTVKANVVIEPPQPAPEMKKADEKVKEFFRKLAGEDMEVDWMELKEILDYAMRNEVSSSSPLGGGGDNIITNLLSLVCGSFFQDSPLASVFGKDPFVRPWLHRLSFGGG